MQDVTRGSGPRRAGKHRTLVMAAICLVGLGAPAGAQSINFMRNECSSVGQTFYRDFNAATAMQYNGQRVDGTHAINGTIYLENRSADFACSYESTGRRMVEFYAEGRRQNAYLPAAGSGGSGNGGTVVQVTGISSNDVLNVRSGPGTGYGIVGALSNGTRVHNLGCQTAGSAQWCQILMMDDMRSQGWVNGRYLTGPGSGQGGTAAQLPSKPAAGGATTTTVVRFPAGASGTELADSLASGNIRRYVLGARNGQFLYFRLAANGPKMSWRLLNPDGSLLDHGQAGKEYRGQLWQSGDHVVEVHNRSNRTQSFNLIFGIN